ncbi:MAG: sigma-70 family RNA polymerase sigma factor [Paramuribaculum sp.]|nr:sigma-70 family RNA polymerase sigma factor [Paramuribaculum sp.]
MTKIDEIENLFRTHYASMYRLAMLILRDEYVSKDIVHDVFEALLVSGKTDVTEAYLLAAVRNRCLKHIRNLSVKDRLKEIYSIDEEEILREDWPDDETIGLIQRTIANDLTESSRKVVNLRFADSKSYQEIADTLGISTVAVYKHLRHAIDVLRKKLSQNG